MWRVPKVLERSFLIRPCLLVLLTGIFSGCLTESQFRPFRNSLIQVEKETNRAQDRFIKLDKETKKSLMAVREDQANIKADMVEMRTEIQGMLGEFSVGRHKEDVVQREGKALEDAVVLQLSHLQQQVQTIEDRVARIEELLALEKKAGAAQKKKAVYARRKPLPAAAKKPAVPAPLPKTVLPEETLYDNAYNTYKAGQYGKAREAFDAFVKHYPKSKYVNNAVFWMGETYYQLKDYESAILKYQEVLEKYPKESKAPAALLKMGFAFEMMGEPQAAVAALERLLREYPLADQVELANKKVAQLKQKKTEPKEDRGNEVKQRPNKTVTEKKPPEKSAP